MKRFLAFTLISLLCITVLGCSNSISEKTNFYYCTAEYQYGSHASVIVSEARDISGHEGELPYLISLYLAGPSDKNLESPFPSNIKLLSVRTEDSHVIIELSYLGQQLSDAEYILACACLTLSTIEFTDAQQVTVISGNKTITLDQNDLLLYDAVTRTAEEAFE